MRRSALALCISLAVASSSVQALEWVQAYELALAHDPAYRGALKEHESGQLSREIGRAALLPVVAINYSKTDNRADRRTQDATLGNIQQDLHYSSMSNALSLRQPLLSYEAMAKYRLGQVQADYSDAVLLGRRQALAVRLLTAWTDALFAHDQWQLANAQVEALAEQKKLNERSLQLGEGTLTSVLETQSKFDLAQALVTEARHEMANKQRVLEGMLGRPLHSTETLDGIGVEFRPLATTPAQETQWAALAQTRNAELIAQRYNIAASEQELAKAQAGHAPKMDLIASKSISKADTITTINQRNYINSLGVQLSIPIYSGGMVSASVKQAVANLQAQQAELDRGIEAVMAEIRTQFNLVLSSQQRLESLTRAEDSAEKLIVATRKSVQGGVRVNVDVLNAVQQLFTVRRDLAQARYSHLNAWLKLHYAAGTLDTEVVGQIGSRFTQARLKTRP